MSYRDITNILKRFTDTPNAPYALKKRKFVFRTLLKKLNIPYTENPYGIIAYPENLKESPKVVLFSHLDHPGFLVKKNRLFPFGTLYLDKIKFPAPISVYDQDGNLLWEGEVSETLLLPQKLDKAYSAMWNIPPVQITQDYVKARSLDNDIATALLLWYASARYSNQKHNTKIVFVFTFSEEVFQISSVYYALTNLLNIQKQDSVIIVESMKLTEEVENPDDYDHFNYNHLVLSLSERGISYGKQANHFTKLVPQIHKTLPNVQIGYSGGSTEAWPWFYLKRTPNVLIINMPNKFKHNVDTNTGAIVPETVTSTSIKEAASVLELILNEDFYKTYTTSFPIAYKSFFNKRLMGNKFCTGARLAYLYRYWIYKDTATENMFFILRKIISRIYYTLLCLYAKILYLKR